MQDYDAKIRKNPADDVNETALRKEAHELLDTMNAEQISQIISYLAEL